MARPEPESVRRIACVGAGLMGGGWAAHFLARGFEVVAQDPEPKAWDGTRRLIDRAWPLLEELGLAEGASPDRVRFTASVAEAVADAEFVQESAPERLALKVKLLAEIDRAARPEAVVASSTSGFVMSDMYGECARPGRMVVGHPFNPPHLMPLVEVGGGRKSDPGAVDWACRFYERAGMYVVKMDVEVPGFVANRMQQALWHEALHMLAAGEATVEQIDAAIAQGPGLRWAMMGHFMLVHLAGGEGGVRHSLAHFGGGVEHAWSRLAPPEMTEALKARIIEGCERLARGRSYADLVRQRDARLLAIRKALSAAGPPFGS
ncbi:MAG: 3-hydroxyacyl-CoA dehydrogenase NAD-binding domain-containing protein [Alphaproteobacteria bacterium]